MLTAFGADPSLLGYSERQIEECLQMIDRAGVNVERESAEHLCFLLKERHKISGGSRPFRAHPEVEKLRLDGRVSPVDAVPADLSGRLYRILGEHADGTAIWDGSAWVDGEIPDGLRAQTSARGGSKGPSI